MATRYVQQAGKQLEPVYSGAIADVNAQIPAAQALYQSLLEGLGSQADAGVEDIVADAERRGVGRARLAQDVGGVLGSAVDLERARLGAQQAGDIAGITGSLSELRQGRVMGRQDLGDSLQAAGIAAAENKFNLRMARAETKQAMREARKQYELDLLTLNRNAEIDRLAAAQAAASSGGGGGGYSSSGGGQQATSQPSDLQRAYNEVNTRGYDVSDYAATLDSAKRGNWYDKMKIMAYHSLPKASKVFGKTVPADAVFSNKVRF